MRRFLLMFWTWGLGLTALAQVDDDFSDGDFTNNPIWAGDVTEFVIDDFRLRSAGPEATATLYLSTPNLRIDNAEWRFLIDLPFEPSGSNQVQVYLVSDQANLENALNGYYLEIGQTGADALRFYRQTGTTRTLLFTGSTSFAGNVRARVKVLRDGAGQWQILADATGGENFSAEGSIFTDNAHTSTQFLGVVCRHTSTRRDSFFFDDFYVGDEIIDTQAPTLQSVLVESANTLLLTFSEALDPSLAQNPASYSLSPSLGNPTLAEEVAGQANQRRLTFASNFLEGTPYTLTVSNVQDLAGNVLNPNPSTANFTYFAPIVPFFRAVVINEIMADPSPSVGLPDTEFIELYNASTSAFELGGWQLSGATLPAYTLPPGDYLILCPSASAGLLSSFGPVLGLANWNTLTNTGEEIRLVDNTGQLIDGLTYNLNWYRDAAKEEGGYTLEQMNPAFPCTSETNWRASDSPLGGTPGAVNAVLDDSPDTTPPAILSFTLLNASQLQITFNETMDAGRLSDAGNYLFDNGLVLSQAQPEGELGQAVILSFMPEIQIGIQYTLEISNLRDCSGNLLPTIRLNLARGENPAFHEILITEIMADPTGNAKPLPGLPEVEWIELHNRSNRVLDLQNCTLRDESETIYPLPQRAIFPGEYLILCKNDNLNVLQPLGPVLGLAAFPDLSNAGELLQIFNSSGALLFALRYSDDWYQNTAKADGGWTLEMIDPQNPCGAQNNWRASENAQGGTPGQVNSIAESRPDLSKPQLWRADALTNQTLRLSFNESMEATSLLNATYTLSGGRVVTEVIPEAPLFKRVLLLLAPPLEPGEIYSVQVSGPTDCSANLLEEADFNQADFGLAQADDSLDILLSELLFNPRPGGDDFVELYNASDKFINLQNWKLANRSEGILANQTLITDDAYVLAPGQYVAITTSAQNIQENYPQARASALLEVNNLPGYSDEEGTVFLINDQNQLREQFDYDENFHFALLDNEEGVSLERIDFQAATNFADNWQSAAATVGFATPGYANSQRAGIFSPQGSISIEPPIFTPDQDGQDDFTRIKYQLDRGGYLMDIRIFDRQGREVRQLLNRQFLGTETGFFVWDGSDNNGNLARMGYYLVWVRLLAADGQEQIYKEKVVVGKRF